MIFKPDTTPRGKKGNFEVAKTSHRRRHLKRSSIVYFLSFPIHPRKEFNNYSFGDLCSQCTDGTLRYMNHPPNADCIENDYGYF